MLDIIHNTLKTNDITEIEITPDQRVEFRKEDIIGTFNVVEFRDDPKWFNFECSGEKTIASYPTPTSQNLASGIINSLKSQGFRVFGHNKVPSRRGHFKMAFCIQDERHVRLFVSCDLFVGVDAKASDKR